MGIAAGFKRPRVGQSGVTILDVANCVSIAALPMEDRQPKPEITELLQAWSKGDRQALETLMATVYAELRRIARRYMAQERNASTLESAALVNEAFLRLCNWKNVDWKSRAHFFSISAQIMRRILVDHARKRLSQKRGGNMRPVTLSDAAAIMPEMQLDLIDLDRALTRLAQLDNRKVQVVEMMFFAQLTVDDVAEVLKVSPLTVARDWKFARAWLANELTSTAS